MINISFLKCVRWGRKKSGYDAIFSIWDRICVEKLVCYLS
jgi:hypothetical protein